MKILIIGAGVVGSNLAEELSEEGHDIVIIDHDAEKIKNLAGSLDVLAITGSAARPSVLKSAGVGSMEMIIAVTNVDEVNIIVCMIAHQLGVKKCIARVRNEEYAVTPVVDLKKIAHLDRIINPEQIVAQSLEEILETPGATHVAKFANGQILLRGFDVPEDSSIVGKTLAELKEISDMEAFLIVGIARNGTMIIPTGSDEIRVGDNIFVLVSRDTLSMFLPLIKKRIWGVHRVMIYGADLIGLNLAGKLVGKVKEVVVIEENEEKAKAAAAQVPKAIVLKGRGTDLDLLKDANIAETDFFLALSSDNENNLVASIMAKKYGAKRTAVLTQDPDYVAVLESMEMDVVVNPLLITVSAILEYIRRGDVRHVVKLEDSEAEVIELVAQTHSKIVGKQLKDIKFPAGALVGTIIKGKTPVIPRGDTIIKPNEKVILFALPEAIKKIEKLFAVKR